MTEVTELLRSETIGKKEDQRPDRHRREPDHEEQPYHDPLDTEYGRKQFVHFLCRRDQLQPPFYSVSPLEESLIFCISGHDYRGGDRVVFDVTVKMKLRDSFGSDLVVFDDRSI